MNHGVGVPYYLCWVSDQLELDEFELLGETAWYGSDLDTILTMVAVCSTSPLTNEVDAVALTTEQARKGTVVERSWLFMGASTDVITVTCVTDYPWF